MHNKNLLRTYHGLSVFAFKLFDIVLLVASGLAVHGHLTGGWPDDSIWKAVVLIAAMVFPLLAEKFRLYQPWRGKKLRHEWCLLTIVSLLTIGGVVVVSKAVGIFPDTVDTMALASVWVMCLIVSLTIVRLVIRPGLKVLRRHGVNQRRILLVGMTRELNDYIAELREHPEFGFSFVGYVDQRAGLRSGFDSVVEHLGSTDELVALCQDHDVDQVWFGYPLPASHRMAEVVGSLKHHPIVMRQVIDLDTLPEKSNSITSILNRPVLDIDLTFTDGFLGHFAKSAEDKVLAASILLAVSPLMMLIALAVKLSSPGPILYRQTRLTWRNQPFEILKFRTMPMDTEMHSGPQWAKAGENRATKVGAFLRATSLDELPQFWNVLKGEMSVVGPRPERPELIEQFKNEIPLYMKKHRVKAGITGWAQINGYRGDTDLKKRIEYDLHYIRHNSLLFDLRIIVMTLFKGFVSRNAY